MANRLLLTLATAALLGGSLPGSAALAAEDASSVEIKGMKNPELRKYRSVSAGLDAFERRHALAPAAPQLRFRLLEARRWEAPPPERLALRIVGNGDPLVLAVDDGGLVTIPRDQAAWDDNADLVSNRKRGQLISMPEVRSPGLADNVRRLGDLRLECEVLTAIIKQDVGFFMRSTISALLATTDWCTKDKLNMKYQSSARLSGATLVHQQRRLDLDHGEWTYMLPIGDPGWPDDALVELRYGAPAPAVAPAVAPALAPSVAPALAPAVP